MDQRRRMRALIRTQNPMVAPGVYDALSARLVEAAGFETVLVSGAAVAASLLGIPDVGLVTMSESLGQTRNIVNSVTIPVVADCDTGYGNPINVRRTVQEFESAGVAALFLEDQVTPKRCGHFDGKELVSVDAMVQKWRAAVEARVDPEMLLIARTDALAVNGLEDAIKRAQAYAKAGADMIFVEAPRSRDELVKIARSLAPLRLPLMINLVEGGQTPLLSVPELHRMGYQLITFSGSLQKVAISSIQGALAELHQTGELRQHYPSRMVSLQARSEILGLPHFMELENRYRTE